VTEEGNKYPSKKKGVNQMTGNMIIPLMSPPVYNWFFPMLVE